MLCNITFVQVSSDCFFFFFPFHHYYSYPKEKPESLSIFCPVLVPKAAVYNYHSISSNHNRINGLCSHAAVKPTSQTELHVIGLLCSSFRMAAWNKHLKIFFFAHFLAMLILFQKNISFGTKPKAVWVKFDWFLALLPVFDWPAPVQEPVQHEREGEKETCLKNSFAKLLSSRSIRMWVLKDTLL